MLEDRAAFQRDLSWLEDLMKFNKNKCKVLHLGLNNLKQQHRVGTDWMGNSSAEKELGRQTEQE